MKASKNIHSSVTNMRMGKENKIKTELKNQNSHGSDHNELRFSERKIILFVDYIKKLHGTNLLPVNADANLLG
jgi:hypothetical protein